MKNVDGAKTECFGVYSGIGGPGVPLYHNRDSDLAVFMNSAGYSGNTFWDILVRDTQGADTREFRFEKAVPITWYRYRLFGYVSRRNM